MELSVRGPVRSHGLGLKLIAATMAVTLAFTGASNIASADDAETPANITAANEQSISSVTLTVDNNVPKFGQTVTVTATVAGLAPTGTVSLFGTVPGQARVELDRKQLPAVGPVEFRFPAGESMSLTAEYSGDANNSPSSSEVAEDITVGAWVPEVAVTVPATVTIGSTVPVKVLVRTGDASGPLPSGSVALWVDGVKTGSANLSATTAAATLNLATSGLAIGAHAVSVRYTPSSSGFEKAEYTGTLAVTKRVSTTAVTVSPSSAPSGKNITAVIAVRSAGITPTGTVEFVGAGIRKTVTLSAGSATVALPNTLVANTYPLVVTYSGSSTVAGSSSTASLTITAAGSRISSSARKVTYGTKSSVSVAVSGATAVATGSVTAKLNGKVLARKALTGGRATLALSPTLKAGKLKIALVYSGDSRYAKSSSTVSVHRAKALPKIGATVVGKPGEPGKVSVKATGAGKYPTGRVTVKQGTRTIKILTLKSGKASYALPNSVASNAVLKVHYSGDTNYLGKKSSVTRTVVKATPSVSIAKVATVKYGKKATVSIKVTGSKGAATGSVSVSKGSRKLASGALNGGRVSLVLPVLSPGSHVLTAKYSGDGALSPRSVNFTVKVAAKPAAPGVFGDGVHKVGTDIRPGLYRVKIPEGELCYWARLKDNRDTLDSILANELARGYSLIRVFDTDRYIESNDCGTWHLVSQSSPWPFKGKSIPGDGTFIVGVDISPGVYEEQWSECYGALLADASGELSDIIENEFSDGPLRATISSDVFAFQTHGCSTWKKVG